MYMQEKDIEPQMFAPCGMNCKVCYKHCYHKNPCDGCRKSDLGKPEHCRKCRIKDCIQEKGIPYCYMCKEYPCQRIKNLDKSYRKRYQASLIENSEFVKEHGIETFMKKQKEIYTCSSCGGIISIHDRECSECHKSINENLTYHMKRRTIMNCQTNMQEILNKEEYAFVSPKDKEFILAFDTQMATLGYTSINTIGEGYCWGRKMIIYTKAGVKSKKSYARIYLRDTDLILRMYFSKIDAQREIIEQAPDYIQEAFTGDYGTCKHCHNQKEDGTCSHRKSYTLHAQSYELCDGFAFWFFSPDITKLADYINIFLAFYPKKKSRT